MDVLTAVLAILVAVAILFEVARRVGVPYPTVFVLGGLGLALVPGLPRVALEPDLVLLVFLPPLLFIAAVETPIRELRAYLAPIVRLALGLVIFTIVSVALVAQAVLPGLGLAAALTLGAIVAPTDALAATSVFRRLGVPRVVPSIVEGAAYLPADRFGLSGVLAAVTAGLVIGSRLGTILTPGSRVLWLSTWKMIAFVLNGFVFVLIGLELPEIMQGLAGRSATEVIGLVALVCAVVVATRFVWIFVASQLPGSPRQAVARRDPRLATRLTFVVS